MAIAGMTGIAALAALISLLVFFAAGGPFGAINDYANGLVGILSFGLAVAAYRAFGGGAAPVAAAGSGAVITVIGWWLVVSDTTGFIFSGFVSTVGFALIGAWVLAVNRSGDLSAVLPPRWRRLGLAAGAAMAVGIIALAGIAMSIDSFEATPPWLWIYGVGWFGTYLLYPSWCLLLARSTR